MKTPMMRGWVSSKEERVMTTSIFMDAVRNMMSIVRLALNPKDLSWFQTPKDISKESRLYWIDSLDGGFFVMETAEGFVRIEHVDKSLIVTKMDKNFFIPEDGTNGVIWSEEVFEGRFIDVCKYILTWKERRENHIYGYFNI